MPQEIARTYAGTTTQANFTMVYAENRQNLEMNSQNKGKHWTERQNGRVFLMRHSLYKKPSESSPNRGLAQGAKSLEHTLESLRTAKLGVPKLAVT